MANEKPVNTVQWSRDWPDSEGHWWFYGWPSCYGIQKGRDTQNAEYALLFLRHDGMLLGDGHFWHQHEGTTGWFAKATLPAPPPESKEE